MPSRARTSAASIKEAYREVFHSDPPLFDPAQPDTMAPNPAVLADAVAYFHQVDAADLAPTEMIRRCQEYYHDLLNPLTLFAQAAENGIKRAYREVCGEDLDV